MAITQKAGIYTFICDQPGCSVSFTVNIADYTGDDITTRGWVRENFAGHLSCATCAAKKPTSSTSVRT